MILNYIDSLLENIEINKKHLAYGVGGALLGHSLATHGILGKDIEQSYGGLYSNINNGLSGAESGWHTSQAAYDIKHPTGHYLDRVAVGMKGAIRGYDISSKTNKIADYVPAPVQTLYDSTGKILKL
jgi:hypothetical protein